MTEPSSTHDDERGREAVAHLQRGALEFIEAARLLLDMAEEAVREPAEVAAVFSETLAALAAAVGVQLATRNTDKPDGGAPRVEHIRIS